MRIREEIGAGLLKSTMEQHVTGIVIHTLPHSDRTWVSRIFVRGLGLRVFAVRPGRAQKGSSVLFQPLNRLSFATHVESTRGIHQLSRPALAAANQYLSIDPIRAAVGIFFAELLHRTLEEDYVNDELFDFLYHAIGLVDQEDELKNMPLWLVISLCRYYGFDPAADDPRAVSDLFHGAQDTRWLELVVSAGYMDIRALQWPREFRREVLADLTHYLMNQLGHGREIRSLPVLVDLLAS